MPLDGLQRTKTTISQAKGRKYPALCRPPSTFKVLRVKHSPSFSKRGGVGEWGSRGWGRGQPIRPLQVDNVPSASHDFIRQGNAIRI